MFLFLAASLFFTEPYPLELPTASAYLVREDDRTWVEDRYDAEELWLAHAVYGRWRDEDDRVFTLAVLDRLPPALATEEPQTRTDYEAGIVPAQVRKPEHVRRQVELLSPVELPEKPEAPHSLPHGIRLLDYWQGTNRTSVVATFLPENGTRWYFASWELADGDDWDARFEAFAEAVPAWAGMLEKACGELSKAKGGRTRPVDRVYGAGTRERELLRRDIAKSIAAYPEWHFTSSDDYVIVDDLAYGRDFVVSVTNEMPALRAKFAAALPSRIDGSNTLAVARIFRKREDYLASAGPDMAWSVAYWCPPRRALVASLTSDGQLDTLRESFRHESFHQFLSYAGGMATAAPWINEGYAQYFENPNETRLGIALSSDEWDRMEAFLPSLLAMDYEQFYAGTDEERRRKYRLAWSVCYFLEKGARKVPFDPFKDIQKRYMDALVATRDMRKATDAAFPTQDFLAHFANEWKEFCLREGL